MSFTSRHQHKGRPTCARQCFTALKIKVGNRVLKAHPTFLPGIDYFCVVLHHPVLDGDQYILNQQATLGFEEEISHEPHLKVFFIAVAYCSLVIQGLPRQLLNM